MELVCALVSHRNLRTAPMLQTSGITTERVLGALNKRSDEAASKGCERAHDGLFTWLLKLLALQMESLVIDPKLFTRSSTWKVALCDCPYVVRDFLKQHVTPPGIAEQGSTGPAFYSCRAALILAKLVLTNGRALKLVEMEDHYREDAKEVGDLCVEVHQVT